LADIQYHWYERVSGTDLEQGDILVSCPVLLPSVDLVKNVDAGNIDIDVEERDVIVMSQSCDLENSKIVEVILCPVWELSEINDCRLADISGKEKARQGHFPSIHMLNSCEIEKMDREYRIVDFRHIYTLPIEVVQEHANSLGDRVRLLPPYREHLSQAFARYFMRVGLPSGIPAFK
jgi:hypothetical protein